jgi:hypothetical protein
VVSGGGLRVGPGVGRPLAFRRVGSLPMSIVTTSCVPERDTQVSRKLDTAKDVPFSDPMALLQGPDCPIFQ